MILLTEYVCARAEKYTQVEITGDTSCGKIYAIFSDFVGASAARGAMKNRERLRALANRAGSRARFALIGNRSFSNRETPPVYEGSRAADMYTPYVN